MGCNYYGRLRFTEELKKEVRELLDLNDFDRIRNILPREIHIGKSSFGWKFIFNHNDWEYFGKQKKQVYKFLEACDIKDEYGAFISADDLISLIESKQKFEDDEYTDNLDGLSFSKSTNFS